MGSERNESFFTNFCPRTAIKRRITANHNVYETRLTTQDIYSHAIMIERIIPYVGLQLVNTGPRDIPRSTLPQCHHFWLAEFINLLDLSENHIFVVIFFHRLGKIVMIQKKSIITHEALVSVFVSIPESTVVACTSIVKMIIDTERAAMMIYGLYLSSLDQALAPNIIGRSGRTQGARIVSIQAKNEMINRVMRLK